MAFGSRVKEVRRLRGLTQQQLADAIGVKQGTINAIESRDARTSKYANDIASALRVSLGWLLSGTGDKGLYSITKQVSDIKKEYAIEGKHDGGSQLKVIGSFDTWDDQTPLGYDEVALPFYKDIELSAGNGRSNLNSEANRKLRFSKQTLQKANVQIKDAITMSVRGDSMERLIMDGATIAVDISKALEPIKDNKIYALESFGLLRCKYLQRLPGDKIKVYSENKIYEDEVYTMEEFARLYRIIGGVFWWSTLERW